MKFLLTGLLVSLTFQFVLTSQNTAAQRVKAANLFIHSLSPELQSQGLFDFESSDRSNWHFTVKERVGIRWEMLSDTQRELGMKLLQTGLSESALKTAQSIMAHEEILRILENRPEGDRIRHPELYQFSFFGKPSTQKPWGWRFEGHHLSLNYTIIEGKQYVNPIFFGSNPAKVLEGPKKGLRILAQEEDAGRNLAIAIYNGNPAVITSKKAPNELLDIAANRVNLGHNPEGVKISSLNNTQLELFHRLLNVYLDKLTKADKKFYTDLIAEQGLINIFFCWQGSLELGQAHYYRIQGPELWIEYDNSQNNANHIHSIFRGIHNDFGFDLLGDHYEKFHKK